MKKLYAIFSAVSVLIRQFVLPNPFEPLGESFTLTIKDFNTQMTPFVANIFAEPILHVITFAVVGIYYTKGKQEAYKGSLMYLLFYSIHTVILYIISVFQFTLISVIIITVIYIALHIIWNNFLN